MQETEEMQVRSLGLEDPPGSSSHGNPLQYSCLENPMDRGAWWATVHGVTQSQAWLKRSNPLKLEKWLFPTYYVYSITGTLSLPIWASECIKWKLSSQSIHHLDASLWLPLTDFLCRNVLPQSPHSSNHVLLAIHSGGWYIFLPSHVSF